MSGDHQSEVFVETQPDGKHQACAQQSEQFTRKTAAQSHQELKQNDNENN
jgi:hypothetical protein